MAVTFDLKICLENCPTESKSTQNLVRMYRHTTRIAAVVGKMTKIIFIQNWNRNIFSIDVKLEF